MQQDIYRLIPFLLTVNMLLTVTFFLLRWSPRIWERNVFANEKIGLALYCGAILIMLLTYVVIRFRQLLENKKMTKLFSRMLLFNAGHFTLILFFT